MKIPVREQKQPRQYIVKALFELLEHKNYHDITISRLAQKANISRRTFYRCFRTKDDVMKYTSALLMDEFADTLLKNHAADLKGIAQSYFEFWEHYIDILLLLKKQHLLYFLEDDMPALVRNTAVKIKHIPPEYERIWKNISIFFISAWPVSGGSHSSGAKKIPGKHRNKWEY